MIVDVIVTRVFNCFFYNFCVCGRFLSIIFEIILLPSLLNGQYNSLLWCKINVIKCKINSAMLFHSSVLKMRNHFVF